MDIATQTKAGLDSLLRSSSSWLSEIKAGRFENLHEVLTGHDKLLMHYIQGIELTNMASQEQEKLYQLLDNHKTAIKIISEQKQQLANKLTKLRKGRSLKNTYLNSSR